MSSTVSPDPDSNPDALLPSDSISEDRDINVGGLISLIFFYLAVLAVGVWAGWKRKQMAKAAGVEVMDQEEMMLAGRDLGLVVGILTTGGKAEQNR